MVESDRDRWAALPRGLIRGESFVGAELTSVVAQGFFDRVDFSGADLRQATLRAAFKMCSFAGANLRGADLRDADLRGARFDYVNTGSDNGRTILSGARFEGADLTGATYERVVGTPPGSESPG